MPQTSSITSDPELPARAWSTDRRKLGQLNVTTQQRRWADSVRPGDRGVIARVIGRGGRVADIQDFP